jgi:hypothetical protein
MEDEEEIKKKVKINDNNDENCLLLKKISDLLTDICDENKNEKKLFYKQLKCFYSKEIPVISIKDYLEHIYKYTKFNSSTLVLILIYIDRICNICNCKISYYNIHKIILGSILIAIKYNEDECFSLKYYAKIGGVSLSEILILEYNFISLINFNLYVSNDLFHKYNDYILSSDSDDDYDYDDIDDNNNIINEIDE